MSSRNWTREEIKQYTEKIKNKLKERYAEKGRNFTFTTTHLAEKINCNGYTLRRFMPHLLKEGIIEKTKWKSRKRIVYRTKIRITLADLIRSCEHLKQIMELKL